MMPLALAAVGEENTVKRIGGNQEVKLTKSVKVSK